jgi:hypothetical protein
MCRLFSGSTGGRRRRDHPIFARPDCLRRAPVHEEVARGVMNAGRHRPTEMGVDVGRAPAHNDRVVPRAPGPKGPTSRQDETPVLTAPGSRRLHPSDPTGIQRDRHAANIERLTAPLFWGFAPDPNPTGSAALRRYGTRPFYSCDCGRNPFGGRRTKPRLLGSHRRYGWSVAQTTSQEVLES